MLQKLGITLNTFSNFNENHVKVPNTHSQTPYNIFPVYTYIFSHKKLQILQMYTLYKCLYTATRKSSFSPYTNFRYKFYIIITS